MAFEMSLFLFTNAPRYVFLGMFIFWRIMYNFGLGVLLNSQSKDRALVRLAKKHGLGPNPKTPRAWWAQYLVNQVKRKMTKKGVEYKYEEMPVEFNVWILYRGLVDVILVNDFTCYILFALAYYQSPEGGYGFVDALRYAAGLAMLLFNLWVKTDAHRVVKDFAWYWGDFFFLVDASLTFDGVFELAPHPMYSVGYIGFYGTALIAQSYPVLFMSLAAHAAQMAFLHFVENPHIDKTYNPPQPTRGDGRKRSVLRKYFGRDMITLKNLDLFRSTDVQTLVIAAYTAASALLVGPIDQPWKFWFYIGQTLLWRVIHTYGLGTVLYLQSKHRFWNRHFIKHGESPREAFHHWKVIYNTTQVMTYVSFVVCAMRLFVMPESIVYGTFLLRATLGLLFIVLHLWIAVSIFEVIGTSGWFYGDFFIDELRSSSGPIYSGLYRYLDNPLLYTFSCWGMAMICGSPALYAITAFGQISNWLFLRYVEQPHMRRLYGSQIRKEAGVERVLRGKVEELEKNAKDALERLVRDLDLVDVLQKIKDVKRQGESEVEKVVSPEAWSQFVSKTRDARLHKGSSHVAMTPPESEDEDDTKNGSLRLRKKPSMDSTSSQSSQGSNHSRSRRSKKPKMLLPQSVERIIEELEDIVDQASPKVRAIVGEQFTKLAGGDADPLQHLPLQKYSLTFPTQSHEDNTIVFRLGEPIVIDFTVPMNAVRGRDWIGIYPVTANPNPSLTTSKSDGRYLYVTGSFKDEWESDETPQVRQQDDKLFVGRTELERVGGTASVLRGRVTFRNDRLPWKVGVYEARYHYDGKYGVVCASRAFEVVPPDFEWEDLDAQSDNDSRVVEAVRDIVEKSLDIDVGKEDTRLHVDEDILERVKVGEDCLDAASYAKSKEDVAKRIIYVLKHTFGIEFSWHVIRLAGTVENLAKRLCDAHTALHPPSIPVSVSSESI
ncbi:phospholipid methyltransferase-domain-containing protein [Gaertneriomyces semiglobifer]|nr:phospholipid methyltransferase-domain-containing protein [Gaertneriomyces semiglobifer]